MSDIHVNHPDWIDPDPTPPHGIPRLSADVLAIVDATLGDGAADELERLRAENAELRTALHSAAEALVREQTESDRLRSALIDHMAEQHPLQRAGRTT